MHVFMSMPSSMRLVCQQCTERLHQHLIWTFSKLHRSMFYNVYSFYGSIAPQKHSTTIVTSNFKPYLLCHNAYAIHTLMRSGNYKEEIYVDSIFSLLAVYRLLTSAFVHGGLLHVAFNMMAFVPIGTSLERMQGTLAFAHLIGLLIFVGGGAYVGFATAAAYIPWR